MLYDVFLNSQAAKKEQKDTSRLRLNGQIQAHFVRLVSEEDISIQAPFVRLVTEEGMSVGNGL